MRWSEVLDRLTGRHQPDQTKAKEKQREAVRERLESQQLRLRVLDAQIEVQRAIRSKEK